MNNWLKFNDDVLLVIDEAYHATAKTYREMIDTVNKKTRKSKILGLTTTPFRETYFDICGYPHYENVVSNVLAFFFDPFKPHELKNTCIEALIHISNPEIENIDEVWEVDREVRTDKGTFIDILIKNDDYVVLIENKVYADLYNDLEGYLRFVKKISTATSYTDCTLLTYPFNSEYIWI